MIVYNLLFKFKHLLNHYDDKAMNNILSNDFFSKHYDCVTCTKHYDTAPCFAIVLIYLFHYLVNII